MIAIIAGSNTANTQVALGGAVGNYTLVPAGTTVNDIRVFVGFATISWAVVAITVGQLTIAHSTNAGIANGRAVGLIRAHGATSFAVIDADIEVGFATIRHVLVAVVEASVACDGTLARGTTGDAVGAVANRGA